MKKPGHRCYIIGHLSRPWAGLRRLSYQRVIFLIGTSVGALIFLIPGVIVWVYQIYNAYSVAKKMNAGEIPFKETSAVHIILYFVLLAVVSIIFIIIMAAVIAAFVFGMAGSTVKP